MNRKSKAMEFANDQYQINVFGRNLAVTDSLRDYAVEKILKIERFGDRIIDATVSLEHQKQEHLVDIVLKFNHTKIKSHASSEDMYASIDKAIQKLQTQLIRYKDKIQDHHGKKISTIDMNVNVLRPQLDEEIIDFNEAIEAENQKRLSDKYTPHRVVNKETRHLKTLTDGEALMKMNLSLDDFLIYRQESDQRLKVMYRRRDGNFGVIEPE